MKEDVLGIRNLMTGIGSAGVGFVVVPEGVEREEYIEDCYRTNTITINGGRGYGYFRAVHVDESVMQNIHFPTDENNRGTAVVWVKDAITQLPVIVASLRSQDNYYHIAENKKRYSVSENEKNVEIFLDATEATLNINVIGDSQNPAKLDIRVNSANRDSVISISSDNEINVTSEDVIVNATRSAKTRILDEGEEITSFSYEKGRGMIYKDEFGNEIICGDEKVQIKSKEIIHSEGKEPMVLGDTLEKLLNDLLTALQKMTVMTPSGQSTVPVNIADFIKIQQGLKNIKSEISKLD